jgi:hypothetical protein
MWIALAVMLVVSWLLLKLVWGVASVAVHFLLAVAAIALIVHFVRGHFGRRTASDLS